jgi:hypothetical protein
MPENRFDTPSQIAPTLAMIHEHVKRGALDLLGSTVE